MLSQPHDNHIPNEAEDAFAMQMFPRVSRYAQHLLSGGSTGCTFHPDISSLHHGAGRVGQYCACARVCERELSGLRQTAICPMGVARQRTIGRRSLRKARGKEGHPFIWGGKGRAVLAALSNIWGGAHGRGGAPQANTTVIQRAVLG